MVRAAIAIPKSIESLDTGSVLAPDIRNVLQINARGVMQDYLNPFASVAAFLDPEFLESLGADGPRLVAGQVNRTLPYIPFVGVRLLEMHVAVGVVQVVGCLAVDPETTELLVNRLRHLPWAHLTCDAHDPVRGEALHLISRIGRWVDGEQRWEAKHGDMCIGLRSNAAAACISPRFL